jgi:hypothetical protein
MSDGSWRDHLPESIVRTVEQLMRDGCTDDPRAILGRVRDAIRAHPVVFPAGFSPRRKMTTRWALGDEP